MMGLFADGDVVVAPLFSVDESVIEYQAGKLKNEKMKEITTRIFALPDA